MFNFFLMGLSSLCSSGQSAFTKFVAKRITDKNTMSFNAMKLLSTFLFFLIFTLRGFAFHIPTFYYALSYGLALFMSTLFGYLALKEGPMAISALIASYSVILPSFYGITILKEELSFFKFIGFLLLLFSMLLLTNKDKNNQVNAKWIIYVFITFLCNGICQIIQKMHQTEYPASFTNEFTVISMLFCFIIFMVFSLKSGEKPDFNLFKYAVPTGICLGLKNFITLILSANVSASVLFPVVTIITIIFNILFSKIIFKDKFNIKQIMGITIGVISVLFIK